MSLNLRNLEQFEKEIQGLIPLHRVAFAASACERLLPNYYVFAREENQGNSKALQVALDEVWDILAGKSVDREIIEQLVEECKQAMIPDEYVFNSEHNYEAHLAAVAIYNTLEACLFSSNIQAIMTVARCLRDTIYEFLDIQKQIKDPNWIKKTFTEQRNELSYHPFVLREIAKQTQDLQRLKEVETLDREFLDWLRYSNNNDGKSLIDLG